MCKFYCSIGSPECLRVREIGGYSHAGTEFDRTVAGVIFHIDTLSRAYINQSAGSFRYSQSAASCNAHVGRGCLDEYARDPRHHQPASAGHLCFRSIAWEQSEGILEDW